MNKKDGRKIRRVLRALFTMFFIFSCMTTAVDAQESILEVTTDENGYVTYESLYNQLMDSSKENSSFASDSNAWIIKFVYGDISYEHIFHSNLVSADNNLKYDLSNALFEAWPVTGPFSFSAPASFTASKDTNKRFYIKSGSVEAKDPTLTCTDGSNEYGAVSVKMGTTDIELGSDTVNLTAGTEYTITVTPDDQYVVKDLYVSTMLSGEGGRVTSTPVFNTDTSASVSFTPSEGFDYFVGVRYAERESKITLAQNEQRGTVYLGCDGAENLFSAGAENGLKVTDGKQYTLRVLPEDGYSIASLRIVEIDGNTSTVVSGTASYEGPETYEANVSFSAKGGVSYAAEVTYTKTAILLVTSHNADGSYNLYLPDGKNVQEQKELLCKLVKAKNPDDLQLVVEYLAGNRFGNPLWKPLDFTPTDGVLHAFGENERETIRFSYEGSNQYRPVYVQADVLLYEEPLASINVNPQRVTYGSSYSYEVTTNPAGLDYLVIAIDLNRLDVYVQVPDTIKEKLGYRYNTLALATEGGISLNAFNVLIEKLADELEALEGTPEDTGVDHNAFRKIPPFMELYLVGVGDEITIELDEKPEKTGEYFLWGITADPGYATATAYSVLKIEEAESGAVLQFRSEMQDNELSILETGSFIFGGILVGGSAEERDQVTATYEVYDAENSTWLETTLNDIRTKPGSYRETLAYSGSIHSVASISRRFTVLEKKVVVRFDDAYPVVTYDGKPHEVVAGLYTEDGRYLENVPVYYVAMDLEIVKKLKEDPSSITQELFESMAKMQIEAPVEPGYYLTVAEYEGDVSQGFPSQQVIGSLSITKIHPSLVIYDYETIYGDYVDFSRVGYRAEGLTEEIVQKILVTLFSDGSDKGEYAMFVDTGVVDLPDKYYEALSLTVGKHIIAPKEVTFTINNAEKNFGEKDPAFSGSFSPVIPEDEVGTITYTREAGELEGTYKITAVVEGMDNYDVKVVAGTLTVKNQAATDDDDKNPEPGDEETGKSDDTDLGDKDAKPEDNNTDASASGDSDTNLPHTGDAGDWFLWIFCIICSFVIELALLLCCRRTGK